MITLSLPMISQLLNGELRGQGSEPCIRSVTTDSRQRCQDSLFVALKGERFDAHDYAADAVAKGAQALLVNRPLPLEIPQIVVSDTGLALGQLAAWVRRQASARVVALTGSTGKTSVKEMCAAILRQRGKVLQTQGNFNNAIGVPLTLLELTPQHDYAVIELGASHEGEIAYTVGLTQPESVLVNNLALAHLQGFGSLEGIARGKGEIFSQLPPHGTAIINQESHDWQRWRHYFTTQRLWRFAFQPGEESDFYPSEVQVGSQGTQFILHTPQGCVDITLPLLGEHSVANAIAASALAISVGATLADVRQGLLNAKAVPGRLFPIALSETQLLLDDSYNANVGSMNAAVNVLSRMPGYRILVVGDMLELGEDEEYWHRQVGLAARQVGIDKVLSVGVLGKNISAASGCGEHFEDKETLITRLTDLLSEQAAITILVKGSRGSAMEQVVACLSELTLQRNPSC